MTGPAIRQPSAKSSTDDHVQANKRRAFLHAHVSHNRFAGALTLARGALFSIYFEAGFSAFAARDRVRRRRRISASTADRTSAALSSPGPSTLSRRAKVPSTNRATMFSMYFFGRAMRSGFDQVSVGVNAISPRPVKALAHIWLNRYLLKQQFGISTKDRHTDQKAANTGCCRRRRTRL